MKTQIWKYRNSNRAILVDISRNPNGDEIASAPATEKGLRWLQEVETAYQKSKHSANTPNTK